MAATALRFNRPARTLTENLYDGEWESTITSAAALTQRSKEFIIPSTDTTSQFVVTTPEIPAWLEPTIAGFLVLLSLRDNWDSYGGKRPSEDLISQALTVLSQIMEVNSPVPSIVPLSDGGLQIEWHRKQQDLEIIFQLDSAPTFYYRDRAKGREQEGFATDASALAAVFAGVA